MSTPAPNAMIPATTRRGTRAHHATAAPRTSAMPPRRPHSPASTHSGTKPPFADVTIPRGLPTAGPVQSVREPADRADRPPPRVNGVPATAERSELDAGVLGHRPQRRHRRVPIGEQARVAARGQLPFDDHRGEADPAVVVAGDAAAHRSELGEPGPPRRAHLGPGGAVLNLNVPDRPE